MHRQMKKKTFAVLLPTCRLDSKLLLTKFSVNSEACNPRFNVHANEKCSKPILTTKNTQNYILSEISKYIPVTIATTCVQNMKYKIHFCATVGINVVNNNHESLGFLTHNSLQLANFIKPP